VFVKRLLGSAMGGEVRRIKLGEATDLLTGFPFKSAEFTTSPNDIRLLRGDNVIQGTTRWEGVKRWRASAINDYREFLLLPGDVVLAMDRPWIEAGLKHATLTEADCPSLLVQRVARLRARPGIDQRFLVISSDPQILRIISSASKRERLFLILVAAKSRLMNFRCLHCRSNKVWRSCSVR
jgi:hypothetical protein